MKEFLIVVSLLLSGVVSEVPAPYRPSGWRPAGQPFNLPDRPQGQVPRNQEYLPPVDPRNPAIPNGFDDNVDVSVQGLPTFEQQPIFQLSPINGQLYTGPSVNADIGRLNPSLQEVQYQQQLQIARQFAKQREYEAALGSQSANSQPKYEAPGQFVRTSTTTIKPILRTPPEGTTTESLDLNESEGLEDNRNPKDQKETVSVEVTKQNIQEYPPELFLNPLSQLKVQGQFVPLQQFQQLNAPIFYQPPQAAPLTQGFDGPAHLSALPSVLAQRELFQQQTIQPQNFAQNPIIVQQEPFVQPAFNQYQPINQYEPLQPQIQGVPQQVFQQQQFVLQSQNINTVPAKQYQTQQRDVEEIEQNDQQPQVSVQTYQPQIYQQFQPSNQLPDQSNLSLQTNYQNQDLNLYYLNLQQQYSARQNQQAQTQGQGALQSGLDINQQGNGIEDAEKDNEEQDEGSKATAVATAFGTRTQPRVFAQYGAPSPIPRAQVTPRYRTTTDASDQEEAVTEDGPAIAEATAVATGRRNAKLRSRRVRPVFTLDKSGHLVLAQQQ